MLASHIQTNVHTHSLGASLSRAVFCVCHGLLDLVAKGLARVLGLRDHGATQKRQGGGRQKKFRRERATCHML